MVVPVKEEGWQNGRDGGEVDLSRFLISINQIKPSNPLFKINKQILVLNPGLKCNSIILILQFLHILKTLKSEPLMTKLKAAIQGPKWSITLKAPGKSEPKLFYLFPLHTSKTRF